ncbi:MAG: VOC family protein, partial [Trebonia sp.]
GLTGSSAHAVTQLFSAPARVLGTTSVLSAVLVSVAGVTFGGSVQAGFERIWGLPSGPWHKIWRQAVWAAGLIAYIYATATVGTVTHRGPAETAGRVSVAVVLGVAFFWWGLRFLLGGRVSYLAALPGAVATIVCLAGLRVFSGLVFEPLIAGNAVSYGALGTVLIVQSWLIGVGWVVYGSQLFGRWFHDEWLQPWMLRRQDQGKTGEQDPEATTRPRRTTVNHQRASGPLGADVAVTHILVVTDPARSRDFWVGVLGAELFREYGGTSVVLSFAGTWLLLVSGGGPTADKPGVVFQPPADTDRVSHAMTLRVADCQAVYEALRSRGATFLTPPHDGGTEVRCFLRDPDGHLVEISQLKAG